MILPVLNLLLIILLMPLWMYSGTLQGLFQAQLEPMVSFLHHTKETQGTDRNATPKEAGLSRSVRRSIRAGSWAKDLYPTTATTTTDRRNNGNKWTFPGCKPVLPGTAGGKWNYLDKPAQITVRPAAESGLHGFSPPRPNHSPRKSTGAKTVKGSRLCKAARSQAR